MRTLRITPIFSIFLLSISFSIAYGEGPTHFVERSISMKGFKGKISLTELPNDRIEIRMRTWRTTRDTVPGREVFPILVNGEKEKFFFGRFGASKIPMLVFAFKDADHTEEARVVAYQVSPRGSLIGQLVVNDESIDHGHTDNVTCGRYALTSIDPKLGAIYSIASQSAKFEGFFVTYEKLRVRQWDPTINAFIETDEGFLRDHSGRLMQSTRFESWTDAARAEVFAANLEPRKPWYAEKKPDAKIIPASAER